jgi:hypothetical protein
VPTVRTETLDKSRDYSGRNARTLQNGYTLRTAAIPPSQASVANEAIAKNAQLGVAFATEDVIRWQETVDGDGREPGTMDAHLESLVGKGFLVAVWSYKLVPGAIE